MTITLTKQDNRDLHNHLPYPCPACNCEYCRIDQAYQAGRDLRRKRACLNCGKEFITRQSLFGPECYLCDYVPGLNRNSAEYRAKVEQYRLLKWVVEQNPNGREAVKLLVCLENARRRLGITEE